MYADQEVLLAAILPMVLIGVALSTALLILALLIYIRVNKKRNPARKDDDNDGQIVTDKSAGINDKWTSDDKPKTTKNELYSSAKDNPPGKDNSDDESKVTKDSEEPYYSTVHLRACAADPQTFKMEKNCAYGKVS